MLGVFQNTLFAYASLFASGVHVYMRQRSRSKFLLMVQRAAIKITDMTTVRPKACGLPGIGSIVAHEDLLSENLGIGNVHVRRRASQAIL